MKKYTLKVYPTGMGREVYRVMELSGDHSLDDLCRAILSAFDFDEDHLYEFCMDNKMYREYNYQSDPQFDEPSTSVTLDAVGLEQKQKFSLHYDFGDDWMFAITVQKITETAQRSVPVVIREKGRISQYWDWEDEDEEDE